MGVGSRGPAGQVPKETVEKVDHDVAPLPDGQVHGAHLGYAVFLALGQHHVYQVVDQRHLVHGGLLNSPQNRCRRASVGLMGAGAPHPRAPCGSGYMLAYQIRPCSKRQAALLLSSSRML